MQRGLYAITELLALGLFLIALFSNENTHDVQLRDGVGVVPVVLGWPVPVFLNWFLDIIRDTNRVWCSLPQGSVLSAPFSFCCTPPISFH